MPDKASSRWGRTPTVLVLSRKNLQGFAAISILFFLGAFAWLILSTNYCSSCGASGLWRYSVLASVPTCLLALLPVVGRKWIPDRVPVSGILSLAAIEVVASCLVLGVAPPFIFENFAQSYDIVYFQSISFPFASGMIILLSVTLGLVSFNVAVAVPEPLKSTENWSLKGCCSRVVRNFLMFLGLMMLIHGYVASSNGLAAFSIMIMSMMMVPLFSLYSWTAKRHRFVRILVGGGTALSVIEIIPHLTDFIGLMIPSHPFTVIPVFSLFLVCISCTIGEVGVFIPHPVGLSRGGLGRYATVSAVVLLFLYVTWTFTHAAIGVWI